MHSSTSKYTYETETYLPFQRHSLIKVTGGENKLCDQKKKEQWFENLTYKQNNISDSWGISLVLAEANTASSEKGVLLNGKSEFRIQFA